MSGEDDGVDPTARPGLSTARMAAVRRLAINPSDKRAATQDALLEAGRRLVIERGIGGMSVGALCKDAGFTRGAFYSNFADVDHFVRRLADVELSRMTDFLVSTFAQAQERRAEPESIPRTECETREAVTRFVDEFIVAMPASYDYYLLLTEITSYAIRHAGRAPEARERYADFVAALRDLLDQALALLGRTSRIDTLDFATLIATTGDRSMRQALLVGDDSVAALTAFLDRVLPDLIIGLTSATA